MICQYKNYYILIIYNKVIIKINNKYLKILKNIKKC